MDIELVVKVLALTVPFNVAVFNVMEVAGSVVTVGATGAGLVVKDSVSPFAVPPALVAEARK